MKDQWYSFINGIDRDDFYDFYSVISAMGEPLCGDVIYVLGEKVNLKKVVRRIRITVMGERFAVDYAKSYTLNELMSGVLELRTLRIRLGHFVEKKSVDKLISALEAMIRLGLWEEGQ